MNYSQIYNDWCTNTYFSEQIRNELTQITDQKEIEDRFYKNLDFGTGGLRGIVASGTNRMNIYTVRKASQGVADYINSMSLPKEISGIAIAYDSRRMSKEFAQEAACVFAANGITVYLYKELMPTPVLSFTVRYLHCAMGIVVTASHNPKEYNGYKVYGMDGGQVTDAAAGLISEFIRKVEPIESAKTMVFATALEEGKIRLIDDAVLDAYLNNVLSLSGDISQEAKNDLKVVYTPLHGTGLVPVTRALAQAGFSNVAVVEQQKDPDTEFSTVKSPNPENHDALELAINLAKKQDADIVIASDPDCDRLGIAARNEAGQFVIINGNQLGCLLLDNCLRSRAAQDKLKQQDYIVKTIVSTRLADAMAKRNNIKAFNVLTGFKYIGEKIGEMEALKNGDFIFGFEESYGYLSGTFVRDKDAVIAALLTCEAAARCKQGGSTLPKALDAMFEAYGYYQEALKTYTLPGKEGVEKIKSLMDYLRNNPLKAICGRDIIATEDYLSATRTSDGDTEMINLPKSNVLRYELDNDGWIAVRPSGTEPKLKVYIGVKGVSAADSQKQIETIEAEAEKLIHQLTV